MEIKLVVNRLVQEKSRPDREWLEMRVRTKKRYSLAVKRGPPEFNYGTGNKDKATFKRSQSISWTLRAHKISYSHINS